MNQKTIETFPENTVLDSTYLMCIEEVFPYLSFRLKIENEPIEIVFYDVFEYNQQSLDTPLPPQLLIQTESTSLKELIRVESEYRKYYDDEMEPPQMDFSECKHYIYYIDHYQFNIFAAGYKKENGFLEKYREQEKVKQIIA